MLKIWSLLKKHWQEDFSLAYYSSVILFLAVSLLFNYYVGLENKVIDRDSGNPIRILWYFLLYGTAYYGTVVLLILFKKRKDLFTSPQFWILTLTGTLLLAINSGFPIRGLLNQFDIDVKVYFWIYALASNLTGFVIVSLPLIFVGIFTNSSNRLYGLMSTEFDLRPYLNLLLIVLPILILASFANSFQDYYPTYRSNSVAENLNWPTWLPMFIYEVAYGLDFFNTEFMFREFMVIGLAHLLGKDSIAPMVSVYCFLHFGKPSAEAISSILGGYVLGVIAFYSKNIWGGLIIHIGIAWMMELMAYLQRIY